MAKKSAYELSDIVLIQLYIYDNTNNDRDNVTFIEKEVKNMVEMITLMQYDRSVTIGIINIVDTVLTVCYMHCFETIKQLVLYNNFC